MNVSLKWMRSTPVVLICGLAVFAQSRQDSTSRVYDASKGAWIHGSVVDDSSGSPLSRAQVILRPVTGATNPIAVETDERGRFNINRVSPGSYAVAAQRDGYLPSSNAYKGSFRLPSVLLFKENTHARDLVFRLRPWAVISGKVRYDDGEAAVGAAVQLYRGVTARGRRTMQLAGSARANDRGEFRIAGLFPGTYIVAAARTRNIAANAEEQEAIDENGRPITEYRYAVTFFPNAQKLADAAAVRVDSAQEIAGLDITLKPVPAVTIRGMAVNSFTGQPIRGANVVFRRVSVDEQSSIPVSVSLRPYRDGFEARGVTTGPYLVTCDHEFEGKRISARRYITVTDAPIDNLDLVLEPERTLPAVIRFDDTARVPVSRLRVNLEPRTDLSPASGANASDKGEFPLMVRPEEHYDAYVENLPPDFFVKSVAIGNMEIGPEGISGNAGGSNTPLEILLSSRSASVAGRAYAADGIPAGGAQLALVPEPARGRAAVYVFGTADEYGAFEMRGVRPGRYTLFAFFDEAPCDIYDEDALVSCRSKGRSVNAEQAGRTSIEVRVSPQLN